MDEKKERGRTVRHEWAEEKAWRETMGKRESGERETEEDGLGTWMVYETWIHNMFESNGKL